MNQLQELQSGDSLDIGNASENVAAFVGVLTATSFSGDGSNLTNLPAGATPTLDAVTTQGSNNNSISVGGVTATGSISVLLLPLLVAFLLVERLLMKT